MTVLVIDEPGTTTPREPEKQLECIRWCVTSHSATQRGSGTTQITETQTAWHITRPDAHNGKGVGKGCGGCCAAHRHLENSGLKDYKVLEKRTTSPASVLIGTWLCMCSSCCALTSCAVCRESDMQSHVVVTFQICCLLMVCLLSHR